MPTSYQQETLESIFGLILCGQGNSVPDHCQTKSASAISRFLNNYQWSTRSLIRTVRSLIIKFILDQRKRGRKPTLQVILDLTTLEKVGNFTHLGNLVRVYNHKKGLHIVVMYLVLGNWRIPWSFRIYRGKGTPSPSQLAQKLLNNLPKKITQNFQVYVLGDTAFGTIKLIDNIRKKSGHAIVGISKNRTLTDGRKVSDIKKRGQQVYLNGLKLPVFLSWIWLKRDGKMIQRFVISTKPMKGKTIARWGKRRWQIEGFFKTAKHRFSLHRFGQKTRLGVYRWLILCLVSYLLAYWVYLHLGKSDNLDWFYCAQQALILLLPHILLLSIFNHLDTLMPWLHELSFDFCLIRCKI
ncbi:MULTISPECIES: transposase [unclassified Moorena]|uniref:transposase n=1 Tax=unclassified Moorena TaxID=2683338 RepID=UPI0013FF70BD|nr:MULTISPECIES: transposase [unclassified Moorena]NEO17827.1 transposase [Moorena sp. SIO3E8]NEQ01022.1 transposase [Moorena sp. SIO3F7]NEQ63154.1 transposase [Moorena sp. SIO4A1]